ncbi:hypothetical protein OF001_U170125 [Pseudomonas sp. OF001]|nr:hypothetical protein OF001_U170125 [Pseudomonas sp. OF001]
MAPVCGAGSAAGGAGRSAGAACVFLRPNSSRPRSAIISRSVFFRAKNPRSLFSQNLACLAIAETSPIEVRQSHAKNCDPFHNYSSGASQLHEGATFGQVRAAACAGCGGWRG